MLTNAFGVLEIPAELHSLAGSDTSGWGAGTSPLNVTTHAHHTTDQASAARIIAAGRRERLDGRCDTAAQDAAAASPLHCPIGSERADLLWTM